MHSTFANMIHTVAIVSGIVVPLILVIVIIIRRRDCTRSEALT